MKAAPLKSIKTELGLLGANHLLYICLRLAKFNKENKELLSYLLFQSHDEQSYVKAVKNTINEQFDELNPSNVYLAKKTIRKVLRTTNKFIKYAGSKQVEIELLLYYCEKMRASALPITTNSSLASIYSRQVQKITMAVSKLHDDYQLDYADELNKL